uniref:Uncharacterized protein n=1 Tax=Klebsiella pneumoniae TaxID=573 RepID=A0A6G9HLE2_KLEPN|nr:hypothetical protein [Klebsiella pneumoniae]
MNSYKHPLQSASAARSAPVKPLWRNRAVKSCKIRISWRWSLITSITMKIRASSPKRAPAP